MTKMLCTLFENRSYISSVFLLLLVLFIFSMKKNKTHSNQTHFLYCFSFTIFLIDFLTNILKVSYMQCKNK